MSAYTLDYTYTAPSALIDGGYVRAYDTEGDELTAQRVLTDRPAALQLTPSEYQRRSNRAA